MGRNLRSKGFFPCPVMSGVWDYAPFGKTLFKVSQEFLQQTWLDLDGVIQYGLNEERAKSILRPHPTGGR